MNKKFVSLLLTAVLSLGVLTGCSSKEESKEADTNTEKVTAEAVDTKTVFVTPEWVQSVIDGNQKESENYVIGEVSWGTYKDSPSYTKGHIPGAIHINTDSVEEGPVWNILSPEKIEQSMLENGITKDTTVILYGDPSAAGRVAFTYLWAGVENVKMLNGGIEAWEKAGYKTETDVVEAKKSEDFGIKVPAHPEYCLSIEDTKEKLKDENFKLVSIRSEDEFLGKTSGYAYINKAGEPEGAVWGFDTDRYVNEDGTCINMEQMKELWNECDFSADNELSFYCGTGWRACVPWLICYENGMTNMTVFDGGWNEWQMDDSNPVQVGDPANDDCVHTTVGELSNDKAAK
ncbi:rhodanese-like domain-containing protein [Peptacetobacter hiranonis]|uniref:Rhodanese-like protein n=1 Tax=Peptacetobacter hiranonis (strain DSM 13275 / JCM 10541 / KCTC 15199 / TO-931) TaxID=500633 RepID=B6FX99_PEPHT|nr:rhodanese-like domain-containing protein [Peptacetobacter hiranonis]EEA85866.1 rhodanese-like protein [Peptacetobacter hiranonis DSM 13275]QEK20530.1 Thiosulfate sulfurtransferase YnjE [Peptacetobacter hiranonis]